MRLEGYGDNREGDIRRSDFRLTVWLVTFHLLMVSSMVLGDFSTSLEMTIERGCCIPKRVVCGIRSGQPTSSLRKH